MKCASVEEGPAGTLFDVGGTSGHENSDVGCSELGGLFMAVVGICGDGLENGI
jgi:hypothetical protein